MITQSELENAIKTLGITEVGELEIGDFTLKYDKNRFTLKYKGEELKTIKNSDPNPAGIAQQLHPIFKIEYKNIDCGQLVVPANINEWKYVSDPEERFNTKSDAAGHKVVHAWKTPYDENYAVIFRQNFDTYRVSIPNEGTEEHNSLEVAVLDTLRYMSDSDPYDLDYELRMRELAEEEFAKIPGIGDRGAWDIVHRKGVYTFDDLLEQLSFHVSDQYLVQAKEEIEERIENENTVKQDEYIREIPTKRIVENI